MLALALASGPATPAHAAELKPATAAAFDRYVRAAEARRGEQDRDPDDFLWVDLQGQPRREELYAQLRRGETVIQHLEMREEGRTIKIPSGMIHHWVGLIFIPQATLEQALALLENYPEHPKIYWPYVRRARILEHNGDEYKVFMQLYKKSIVTAVVNTEYDVQFFADSATRAHSVSYSRRIAEVADFGKSDEHELPVGKDHGYLWRLNSYWRLEEKDGGVYLQLETIALTRGVPPLLGWLINPLIKSIPRESLTFLLEHTRAALETRSPTRASPQEERLSDILAREKERGLTFRGGVIPADNRDHRRDGFRPLRLCAGR